jgi:hypothetical protein
MECCFCGNDVQVLTPPSEDTPRLRCPRCGTFGVASWLVPQISREKKIDKATVSGWIRAQNLMGVEPVIHNGNANDLALLRKPGFKERAEAYLIAVANKCISLDATFFQDDQDVIGISYSRDAREAYVIRNYIAEKRWIEHVGGGKYKVNPEGYIAADELRTRRAKSSQGFIAMWFSPDMKPVFEEGLRKGVQGAGFKPMRIDQKEHANRIDDEIIAEIRRSAFVVADFTGHRGGVYFEAGFAMGLGLPVIWTCAKCDIDKLHFDIRQYNCIDWDGAADLATRLAHRIEAMLGRGPVSEGA